MTRARDGAHAISVAILEEGPLIVEGNEEPDMDLMQRFMETGFFEQRFGALVAWHLRSRVLVRA